MDNHISDIYIRSFRGISNLELKDIKLINILTGDNNGGKTSVLEVIQSIKNPFDFRTWRSLIRRGERISVIRGMSYYEGFYDLFDINKEEKIIEYDVCLINGQKYNVKVIAERVEEEIMEKDLVKLQGDYNAMDEDSLQDNFLNVSKLNLKTFLDLIVLQEERRKCIILVLFIIFSNAIIVFAVGYCMVYSFQKDLIEKNRRNKRKEPKKNLSRKHKYRWKNKDYQLIGWLLIIVAIVFYGAYVNWQGIQNAQKQELFLTTRIDNDTYIVVMTDGDEAILEKDRTGKDGKLKICKDKYMKVDCKNRLLEKKKYRRASGDGE